MLHGLAAHLGDGFSLYARWMDSFVRYTPTWTAEMSQPKVCNASLEGWLDEAQRWAAIRLTFGSDAEPGSGAWQFTCPIANVSMVGTTIARRVGKAIQLWVGYATVADEVLSVALSSTERDAAGERLSWANSGEVWIPVGAGIPFDWQAGDVLQVAAGAVPTDFRWQELATATV